MAHASQGSGFTIASATPRLRLRQEDRLIKTGEIILDVIMDANHDLSLAPSRLISHCPTPSFIFHATNGTQTLSLVLTGSMTLLIAASIQNADAQVEKAERLLN